MLRSSSHHAGVMASASLSQAQVHDIKCQAARNFDGIKA